MRIRRSKRAQSWTAFWRSGVAGIMGETGGAFANLVFGKKWILYVHWQVLVPVVDTVTGLVLVFIGEIETDPRMSTLFMLINTLTSGIHVSVDIIVDYKYQYGVIRLQNSKRSATQVFRRASPPLER